MKKKKWMLLLLALILLILFMFQLSGNPSKQELKIEQSEASHDLTSRAIPKATPERAENQSTQKASEALAAPLSAKSSEEQLEDVNKRLESLRNLENYYTAKAVRYRERADRLQFQGDNLTEAQRLWRQADNFDSIAQSIREAILKTTEERDALIKECSRS